MAKHAVPTAVDVQLAVLGKPWLSFSFGSSASVDVDVAAASRSTLSKLWPATALSSCCAVDARVVDTSGPGTVILHTREACMRSS